MAISDTAQRNHEEWLPNHRSTLQVTDPELIEIFEVAPEPQAGG